MSTLAITPSKQMAGNSLRRADLDRRTFLKAAAATAFGPLKAPTLALAERDRSGTKPVRYPDPDIVTLDPRFGKYVQGNAAIQRLRTGAR